MTSPFDQIRHIENGQEIWYGRELMGFLDYSQWRDFSSAIDRALVSCQTHGAHAGDHFSRTVTKTGGRPREDYKLSRFAAYLVSMCSDPRKRSVADAQAYFAVRTREAELSLPAARHVEPALPARVKGVPPLIEFPVIGGRTLGDKDAVQIAYEGLQVVTYLLTMVNVTSKNPELKFRTSTTTQLLWDLISGAGRDIKSLAEQAPPN